MITADDVLFVADDCCNAMHIGQQLHMYIPLENLCSDIESDYFVERTAGSGLLIFVCKKYFQNSKTISRRDNFLELIEGYLTIYVETPSTFD